MLLRAGGWRRSYFGNQRVTVKIAESRFCSFSAGRRTYCHYSTTRIPNWLGALLCFAGEMKSTWICPNLAAAPKKLTINMGHGALALWRSALEEKKQIMLLIRIYG
jgi:hypothetical protein